MSSANVIVSNMQDKTFGGTQQIFGSICLFRRAVLMTKDLLGVLFLEFKSKVPVSEYSKSQKKDRKEKPQQDRNDHELFWNNIDFQEIDD